jgi:hypothetical protein
MGLYCEVSQIHVVVPRAKLWNSGPFDGKKHQNCLTTQTGLQAVPHDVQAVEGKKRSSSHYSVSARKIKTLKEY